MGNHNYLFVSRTSPDDFLSRDFPGMFSAIRKLEYEHEQLEKIKTQNLRSEKQVQKLLDVNRYEEISEKFPDMKEHQFYFQRNTARLTKLRETLDINILILENYCEEYGIGDSPLFAPILRQARKSRKQTEYDLSYARAGLEEMESQLQFLEFQMTRERLKIEQRREKGQRRIEWGLAIIGVFLGIGGATTNMKTTEDGFRLILMVTGAMIVGVIWWVLSGRQK